MEVNISEQNYCLLRAQVCPSAACAKQKQTGVNSSHRQTEAVFVLLGSHLLCSGINVCHSLLYQQCTSLPWGPGRRSQDLLASQSCLVPLLPCPGALGASLLSLQLWQSHAGILYVSVSCWKEYQGNCLSCAHIHRPGTPHILAIYGAALLYLPFLTLILVFCC